MEKLLYWKGHYLYDKKVTYRGEKGIHQPTFGSLEDKFPKYMKNSKSRHTKTVSKMGYKSTQRIFIEESLMAEKYTKKYSKSLAIKEM